MHMIACEVFRPELEYIAAHMQHVPTIWYMEQGLHDTPEELRARVQCAVDKLEAQGERTIVLAYGLCGRGLSGVTAKSACLVIPRVHDCIPVLLGKLAPSVLQSSTYWSSPGWLAYSQLPFINQRAVRRADYVARFGDDSANYLMEMEASWLQHYTHASLIDWGVWSKADTARFMQEAQRVADDAALPLHTVAGAPDFVQALLLGGDERCLYLEPGFTIDVDGDGEIRRVLA